MADMIDTSTEAVKALMDGVTPGPWQSDGVFMDRDHEVRVAMPDDCGVPMATIAEAFHNWNDVTDVTERRISWKEAEANARFIAAARDLVPALLSERDALRDRLDTAVALLIDASADLTAYVDADYPPESCARYPDIARRHHRDLELVRRIAATIAKIKGADHE